MKKLDSKTMIAMLMVFIALGYLTWLAILPAQADDGDAYARPSVLQDFACSGLPDIAVWRCSTSNFIKPCVCNDWSIQVGCWRYTMAACYYNTVRCPGKWACYSMFWLAQSP